MNLSNTKFVPHLLSRGGACLTNQNWKDVGIDTVVCSLEQLLFKPGLNLLWELPNLASWLSFEGSIILDAQIPLAKSQKTHQVFSPWDGSSLSITTEILSALIKHLKPDYVILPDVLLHNISLGWPDARFPVSPFTVTDKPAEDGLQGLIYTEHGTIDIKENSFESEHIPLDKNCRCKVCEQLFTRAYFHHLYLHTPLLAQRFLIMHNLFWYIKNH